VSTGEGTSAGRSIAVDLVERVVEYYEAVFRKVETGETSYYRGAASSSAGKIIVDVPIGEDYTVLVLAGTKNHVLLAGGYRTEVTIEPNKVNVIEIPMTKFPLEWNTEKDDSFWVETAFPDGTGSKDTAPEPSIGGDFTFTADLDKYDSNPKIEIDSMQRLINVAPEITAKGLGAKDIGPNDTFTMTVELNKLKPLFRADNVSIGFKTDADQKLTLESWKVSLWLEDSMVPITFTQDDPKVPSLEASTVSFTSNSPLPDRDVEGVLEFGLGYRAFGIAGGSKPGSEFTSWVIRNGIRPKVADNIAELDSAGVPTGRGTGDGSEFLVKFGNGTAHSVEVPLPY
jgi:hypothetical protein